MCSDTLGLFDASMVTKLICVASDWGDINRLFIDIAKTDARSKNCGENILSFLS